MKLDNGGIGEATFSGVAAAVLEVFSRWADLHHAHVLVRLLVREVTGEVGGFPQCAVEFQVRQIRLGLRQSIGEGGIQILEADQVAESLERVGVG